MFEDIDTRGKIMYHLKIKNAFTKIDKPNIWLIDNIIGMDVVDKYLLLLWKEDIKVMFK
jgi:hypothetical protein